MKKHFLILMVALLVAIFPCSNELYRNCVNALYDGNKTNVLRLPNSDCKRTRTISQVHFEDIEIAFLDLMPLRIRWIAFIEVGETITTTNFVTVFPKLEGSINHLKAMIPLYPPDELAADQGKGNISGKPLPHADVLQALEDDGYFE